MGELAYAEYTSVDASKAIKIPDGLPPKIAAGAILQGLTALTLVREAHPVKKGDWVLVHAGAGGVGLPAIQISKALGAKVIATAGSKAKLDVCKRLGGADHVIDYNDKAWTKEVLKLTNGKGVGALRCRL